MPSGLVALLDDVAAITKLAATSLDDVAAATGKAGSKAMGVVVDDAAVTPRYVAGFTAARELPIIGKIAIGSLRNKLLILLPAALLLSAFAPWLVTPLLMLGGAYLCFEGTEKVVEAIMGGHAADAAPVEGDAQAIEQQKVSGAIRTDLILSAEIMAIALAEVARSPIVTQAIVLALVSVAITIGVYGVVALIVKMDDIGLLLARRQGAFPRTIGRGLVTGMPILMRGLSIVGTAAMIWVGGGILIHGLETFGLGGPALVGHALSAVAARLPAVGGAAGWTAGAIFAALIGLIAGGAIVLGLGAFHKLSGTR
jgi:predicted DNA repair protein MutK